MQEREFAGNRRGRIIRIAFGICVFAFLLLFFGRIHPLMMHDGDDWGYASYSRGALPIWGYWNPTRVLPEILSPLGVYLGGYIIYPLLGDFSWSLTLSFALLVSAMITVYIMAAERHLRRNFGLPTAFALMIAAQFFLFHFLVFRSQSSDNVHLFYCWNVNTYFFYLIPALFNVALVLGWDEHASSQECGADRGVAKKAVLLLFVYLAVFSNLYCSQILAIYCGVRLMICLAQVLMGRKTLDGLFRKNAWLIAVLALWLVSVVFELNGGRAGSMDSEAGYIAQLKSTVWYLLDRLRTVNGKFVLVSSAAVLVALALLVKSGCKTEFDQEYAQRMIQWVLCGGFSLLYLILLSAAAAPGYIMRPDVLFGAAFFALMIVITSLAYIARRAPRVMTVMPLLLFVLVFETDTRWKTFKEPNISNLPAQECADINNAMIEQLIEADREGLTTVELRVPEGPYPWYMGDGMARTLLKCGLIHHAMDATAVTVDDFYEVYEIWGHGAQP